MGFRRMARLKPDETVVFAWVVYRSRAPRDRVHAAVMKARRMDPATMKATLAFDPRRFAMGGFDVLVSW
jgi:uncharacterized protein YbaA (DUF1428 family)